MARPGKGGARLCGGHRAGLCEIRGQGSGAFPIRARAPVRYQRSGCRQTEYHRPRFFSFHCGSAHSRFSCSGEIVEPVVAGLSSEQPPTMARTASINNPALNRPAFRAPNPVGRASAQPTKSSDANAASTVKQNHHRSTSPGRRLVLAFPSLASSIISRSVTQLEQARMAERHFRHHGLVVGRDGAVARVVVDAVFAQELRHKNALVTEFSKAAPEIVILPADILGQDRVAADFEQPLAANQRHRIDVITKR